MTSLAPTRTVRSSDVELAVYEWGRAGAKTPTLVLVHGYPDAASVWTRTAQALAARYHVIAYDVRGAGRSSAPDHTAAYAIDHLVGDLAAVIEAVSPAKAVHLVCHDWGSIACWEAVTTERLRGRIASYVTMSGPSLDHAGYWILQRLKSGSPEQLAQVARQVAHSWYVGLFHLPAIGPAAWKLGLDQVWPKILERVDGVKAEASATQREDGSRGVKLYRANFARRLMAPQERRTDVPVLLIWPKRDKFMVPEIWDDLPQWASRVWKREMDAGHWLQVSHPGQVAAWVGEFVDHIEGAPASAALRRARLTGTRRPWSGKLVVVTGAGSGIGRETLFAFAEAGATVVAADIDLKAAERSAEMARLLDVEAWARKVDVGSTAEMESFARWVEQELGAPDVVVNNAGIGMAGRFLDTSVDDWERILRVNLWSVIHGARLFGKQMGAAGRGGHIVNVASAAAYAPSRTLPAYATTKAAVRMLSDCMRAELEDSGVRVISVCPGFIDTGITTSTKFVGQSLGQQDAKRARAKHIYQRRNLKPQAVAAAILDAIARNRLEVRVGLEAHGLKLLSRLLPDRLSARLARMELS